MVVTDGSSQYLSKFSDLDFLKATILSCFRKRTEGTQGVQLPELPTRLLKCT